MLLDTEIARGLVVPPCLQCKSDRVRPLQVSEVDPIVHYWSCDACGLVWATRDGEEARSIAAGQQPEEVGMIHRETVTTRRAVYDDDLQSRRRDGADSKVHKQH